MHSADSKSPEEMVREFHQIFGLVISESPDLGSKELRDLRVQLIAEEFEELVEALQMDDSEGVADALADLAYVIYGAGVSFGIPLTRIFEEVHRSNMSKLWDDRASALAVEDPSHPAEWRVRVGDEMYVVYRADGKVLKPPTFQPPRVAEILSEVSTARESEGGTVSDV